MGVVHDVLEVWKLYRVLTDVHFVFFVILCAFFLASSVAFQRYIFLALFRRLFMIRYDD